MKCNSVSYCLVQLNYSVYAYKQIPDKRTTFSFSYVYVVLVVISSREIIVYLGYISHLFSLQIDVNHLSKKKRAQKN
jgi:hypothetical protein